VFLVAALTKHAADHTVIIGGGIVGLCSAWYLARRGRRVTVFDSGSIADSASAGNAGIVAFGHPPLPRPGLPARALRWLLDPAAPFYIQPRFDPEFFGWLWRFRRACNTGHVDHCLTVLAALGRLSRRCWEEMLAAESLDPNSLGGGSGAGTTGDLTATDSAWWRSGWLDVYRTAEAGAHVLADAQLVRDHGFEVEELAGDGIRRRDAAFGDDVLGAVYYPESRSLDPGRFLCTLAERLSALGVAVHENTSVATLTVADGVCRGVTLADGRQIASADVVLAAGAWSTHLARDISLRLPLQAGKGYHLDLVAPVPCPATACVLNEAMIAVTPLGDRLRLAGTVEFSGLNLRLHERRLRQLLTGARRYLRGLDTPDVAHTWCGLRPCTADGLPVIGETPAVSGLFIATGHAKMGLTHGPGTGRLIAELILDGKPSLDITPLRADRSL